MDFLKAAQSGQLEEVRLFRKAGMNQLADYGRTCDGLGMLLFDYAGPSDLEGQIWDEVAKAVGTKQITACKFPIGDPVAGYYTPNSQQLLQSIVDFYKGQFRWNFVFSDASALMGAVWLGNAPVVKSLLANGVDPNNGVNKMGEFGSPISVDISPLSEAKRLGNKEIIKLLDEKGAKDIRVGAPA